MYTNFLNKIQCPKIQNTTQNNCYTDNHLQNLSGLNELSFLEKTFNFLDHYVNTKNYISLQNLRSLVFEVLKNDNTSLSSPSHHHLRLLLVKKLQKNGLMHFCESSLQNFMFPIDFISHHEYKILSDIVVTLLKDPMVILNDPGLIITFLKSLIQMVLSLKNRNHFILEKSRIKIDFLANRKMKNQINSRTEKRAIKNQLQKIKATSNNLMTDILNLQTDLNKKLKKVKTDFSKNDFLLLKRSSEESDLFASEICKEKEESNHLNSSIEQNSIFEEKTTDFDEDQSKASLTSLQEKVENKNKKTNENSSISKNKESNNKSKLYFYKNQLTENIVNKISNKKSFKIQSKNYTNTEKPQQMLQSVFSKNQLPYYQWNSSKPLFFWDGLTNLKIVSNEISSHIAKLFNGFRAPSESIIKLIQIKAFTKKKNKPNLLIMIINVNPRYEELINKAWKNGSPSEYFKFKIDLKQSPKIKCWNRFLNDQEIREIPTFKNCPGRFNFSQAFYDIKSKSLSCQKINQMCQEQVKINLKSFNK